MTIDWRRVRRVAFWCYVPVLFTATHWPKLKVPLPGERPDLLVHFVCFGLWNALLIGAGYFGPVLSARNIVSASVVSAAYAALDEALQVFPIIQRTCALDDWAANMGGVAIVAAAATVAGLLAGVFVQDAP